jgi:hypothetical protein
MDPMNLLLGIYVVHHADGALYECPTRVLGSAENCQSEFAAKSTIPLATVPY